MTEPATHTKRQIDIPVVVIVIVLQVVVVVVVVVVILVVLGGLILGRWLFLGFFVLTAPRGAENCAKLYIPRIYTYTCPKDRREGALTPY